MPSIMQYTENPGYKKSTFASDESAFAYFVNSSPN